MEGETLLTGCTNNNLPRPTSLSAELSVCPPSADGHRCHCPQVGHGQSAIWIAVHQGKRDQDLALLVPCEAEREERVSLAICFSYFSLFWMPRELYALAPD